MVRIYRRYVRLLLIEGSKPEATSDRIRDVAYKLVEMVSGGNTEGAATLFTYDGFFFSSRRRHTILQGDWSSDVCSSDLRGDHSQDYSRATRTNVARIRAPATNVPRSVPDTFDSPPARRRWFTGISRIRRPARDRKSVV